MGHTVYRLERVGLTTYAIRETSTLSHYEFTIAKNYRLSYYESIKIDVRTLGGE